jgi:hypothetical protein
MYKGDQLAVLPPELLPSSPGSLAGCLVQGHAVARAALQRLTEISPHDLSTRAAVALDALERIRTACAPPVQIESDPFETPMNRENDKALYIYRTTGVPALVLLSSAVQVYSSILDELVIAGTDLSPECAGCMHLQFTVILDLLSGRSASYEPDQAPLALPVSPMRPGNHDPLRRWVRGHHAFIVVLQWQVIFFQCFRRSVESPNGREEAARFLKLLILSMRASLQIFRFASEFSTQAYADVVRPTLMPPLAPEGMSGVNWRDHHYLLNCFTNLDAAVGTSDSLLRSLCTTLKSEVRSVYDAHKLVCARFVGTDVSLVSKTSAVAIIDRLKEQRSRLL